MWCDSFAPHRLKSEKKTGVCRKFLIIFYPKQTNKMAFQISGLQNQSISFQTASIITTSLANLSPGMQGANDVRSNGFLNVLSNMQTPITTTTLGNEGKIRTVRVSYIRRSLVSSVVTGAGCAVNPTPTYETVDVPAGIIKQESFEVTLDSWKTFQDEAFKKALALPVNNFIMGILLSKMDAVRTALDVELLTALSTQLGAHVATGVNTARNLNILNASTGQALFTGYQEMLTEQALSDFKGRWYTISDASSAYYKSLIGLKYGGSSDGGVDFQKVNMVGQELNNFIDNNVDDIFGANRVVAIDDGSCQMFTALSNVGANEGQHAGTYYSTLQDPVFPNLYYDLYISEKDCNNGGVLDGSIVIRIKASVGLFVPPNAYQVGDEKVGYRGNRLYNLLAV